MSWLGQGWGKVEGSGGDFNPTILNSYAKTTYVDEQITIVNNELETTNKNVKKNSDDIEVTNGHVNTRISELENKIDEIEPVVNNIENIENKVNKNTENITNVTAETNTLKETINTVKTKTVEVENKVNTVKVKTTELETTVKTIKENTTTLLERVEKVETVVTNPNLLYNSTGIMNLNGYISTTNTINYRDRYISDKDSFFYITGPNGPTGFVSQSVPVSGGKTYTFSGYFFTHGNSIDINVGYQTENELNTINSIEVVNICKDQLFEGDWTFFEKTFIVTDNSAINGMYLQIIQNGTNTTAECFIKKMKIEEGEKSTSWVAEITDPYQNQISIGGLNAAAFSM